MREKCRRLTKEEILSPDIQNLIKDMRLTIQERKTGVGLSANQVNRQEAINVIAIKPTPARPNLKEFDKVCINTEIVETFGDKVLMWEGCLSTATDINGEPSMALVPRYEKISIKYLDEHGNQHEEVADGFVAHILQHEIDHLNGILFTDLIDEKDLIIYQEYISKFAS